MIISISGKAGAGKSVVGEILAKKLNYKFYCIGDMRRKLAEDRGMTLEEFNKLGEKSDATDHDVDMYQTELGKKEDNFIVIGRTSFHFIPQSFKIFFDCRLDVAAKRIMNDAKRDKEKYQDLGLAMKKLEERDKSDAYRYKKYYGIDLFDMKNYDYVIDTSDISINEVVKRILGKIKARESKIK